jgi:hypothetical protein
VLEQPRIGRRPCAHHAGGDPPSGCGSAIATLIAGISAAGAEIRDSAAARPRADIFRAVFRRIVDELRVVVARVLRDKVFEIALEEHERNDVLERLGLGVVLEASLRMSELRARWWVIVAGLAQDRACPFGVESRRRDRHV